MGYSSIDGGDGTHWTKYDHATAIAARSRTWRSSSRTRSAWRSSTTTSRRYFKPSNSPGQWKIITHELTHDPAPEEDQHRQDPRPARREAHPPLPDRDPLRLLRRHRDHQEGPAPPPLQEARDDGFQILDPTEIEFPFEDVTLFKGLEEMGELLTEPRPLREGYLDNSTSSPTNCKKLCRGMHIDFTA